MAVRTSQELIDLLQKISPDNNSDDMLELMEDIADSVGNSGNWEDEISKLRKQLEEAEQKVKDTENEWRTRYRERFMGKVGEPMPQQEAQDLEAPETEVIKTVEEVANDWS